MLKKLPINLAACWKMLYSFGGEVKLMSNIATKIVSATNPNDLETLINGFLSIKDKFELIDIKLSQSEGGGGIGTHYTALIIFKKG